MGEYLEIKFSDDGVQVDKLQACCQSMSEYYGSKICYWWSSSSQVSIIVQKDAKIFGSFRVKMHKILGSF